MKLTPQSIENIIGHITHKADFKSCTKILDLFKSVRSYDHEVSVEVSPYEFYSRKEGEKQLTCLSRGNDKVIFQKKNAEFQMDIQGEGALANTTLDIIARKTLKELVTKSLYLLTDDELYEVEDHKDGYLLKNPVSKEAVRYFSYVEMYEMFCSCPQKEFEDKIIMLEVR